jgi:hypothetical protein
MSSSVAHGQAALMGYTEKACNCKDAWVINNPDHSHQRWSWGHHAGRTLMAVNNVHNIQQRPFLPASTGHEVGGLFGQHWNMEPPLSNSHSTGDVTGWARQRGRIDRQQLGTCPATLMPPAMSPAVSPATYDGSSYGGAIGSPRLRWCDLTNVSATRQCCELLVGTAVGGLLGYA